MSAAPSWPLISSPLRGEPSGARLPSPPGLISIHFKGQKRNFRGLKPESVLPTFKTQNDARGASNRTRPSKPLLHGLQKPEIAYLPTACEGKRHSRRPPRFRAATPIWGNNRRDSRGQPANPHTFPCMTHSGSPLLHASCLRWLGLSAAIPVFGRPIPLLVMAGPDPAIHVVGGAVPGSRSACPGMELTQAALTSIPPSRQPFRAGP